MDPLYSRNALTHHHGLHREKTLARIRAVKVLNYALSGEEGGRDRCIRFVDASGLKALFPLFMGKGNKKLKKSHHSAFNESEDEGNCNKHYQLLSCQLMPFQNIFHASFYRC